MIKLAIRFIVLAMFLMAPVTLPAVTPIFAMGGGGGGGSGGGGGGGGDPYGGAYSGTAQPSYPKRPGAKPTQRGKRTDHHSRIDDPAVAQATALPWQSRESAWSNHTRRA